MRKLSRALALGAAEIGFDHRGMFQDVVREPFGQRAAVIQHVNAVGEIGGILKLAF